MFRRSSIPYINIHHFQRFCLISTITFSYHRWVILARECEETVR